MKLSIIIVNWNSKDYLRSCLMSIRHTCGGLSPQVIVVDGGSYDGCGEMLTTSFPEVEFIQSPGNIGFGRSNNLGFSKATGEALLLLNPDTELRHGAVEVLLEHLQSFPDAGLIGARLLNSDGSLQLSSVHSLPTPWNVAVDSERVRRRWWRKNGSPQEGATLEVEAVSGACMMMRSETFQRLGGFDPSYFMYAEDMDMCFRIRRSGLGIYHATQAQVLHHGGGSSRTQFSKFSVVMMREAIHVYILSNQGKMHAGAYRFLMASSSGLRVIVLLVCTLFTAGENRASKWISISKWWTTLRWSLGMERWAKRRFACHKNTESLATAAMQIRQAVDL